MNKGSNKSGLVANQWKFALNYNFMAPGSGVLVFRQGSNDYLG